MKKVMNLFTNVIPFYFIIIIFGYTISNAECPPDYNSVTIPFTYYDDDGGIHHMTLTYCYKCSMTGFGFDIYIDEFGDVDGVPMSPSMITQATTAMLVDFLNSPYGCIAPCDFPGWKQKKGIIHIVTCWKHEHTAGDPPNLYSIRMCQGGAECVSVYEICVYYDETGAHLREQLIDKYLDGTIDCSLWVEPMEPPQGADPYGNWETECFVGPNDCTME